MDFAYNVGWDKTAIRYAEKSYDRFGDAYYVSRAMEIAAEEVLDGDTERYAEILIAHEDFEDFCVEMDAKSFRVDEDGNRTDEKWQSTYKQHVYVNLCTAKYRLGKKNEAIEAAYSSLDGKFPPNNALAAVFLNALKAGDTATAQAAAEKFVATDEGALSNADKEYLAAMKGLAASIG